MTPKRNGDHDTLIRIETKLDILKQDFVDFRKETAQNFARKAESVDLSRLSIEVEKLDVRLTKTEKFMWKALGVFGFIEAVAAILFAIQHYVRW